MTRQEIIEDPSVHYWVKDVIKLIADKDPVDVLHGLRLLMELTERELITPRTYYIKGVRQV